MKINISTYKDNTVYSVEVIDKYNERHHLGYINVDEINSLTPWHEKSNIGELAKDIWENAKPPCPEARRLSNAIGAMIKADKTHFTDNMGNHRDGLD